MDYLITGGAGFIGSHLADTLLARGDRVVALDDESTGSIDNVATCSTTRASSCARARCSTQRSCTSSPAGPT